MAFAFLLLVHAVHHVRHPADATLDATKFEIGKELEDAFEYQRGELANLRKGMFQGVTDGEVIDRVEAESRHAQTAVGRDRHVELCASSQSG